MEGRSSPAHVTRDQHHSGVGSRTRARAVRPAWRPRSARSGEYRLADAQAAAHITSQISVAGEVLRKSGTPAREVHRR
jgi:hypothetical protein